MSGYDRRKIVSLRELFFKAECLKINAKKALPVILKMAPKASVYLFGSLARGEIHEESDADLFVNSGVNFTSIEQREQFKINLADLVDNVCQDVHVVVDDPFSQITLSVLCKMLKRYDSYG